MGHHTCVQNSVPSFVCADFSPASTGSRTFVLFHVGVLFIFSAFGISFVRCLHVLKWIPYFWVKTVISKFPLSRSSQNRLGYKENNIKYRSLSWKPQTHVRILIIRHGIFVGDKLYNLHFQRDAWWWYLRWILLKVRAISAQIIY